jgi:hypothetical protein
MKAISTLTLCTIGLHTESILVGAVCLILVVVLTYKRK